MRSNVYKRCTARFVDSNGRIFRCIENALIGHDPHRAFLAGRWRRDQTRRVADLVWDSER